jgi:hypothetical protein
VLCFLIDCSETASETAARKRPATNEHIVKLLHKNPSKMAAQQMMQQQMQVQMMMAPAGALGLGVLAAVPAIFMKQKVRAPCQNGMSQCADRWSYLK